MKILRMVVMLGLCACGPATDNAPDDTGGIGDGGPTDGASGNDAGGGDAGGGTIDINKSGTRIKARVFNTPDGAKQFLGWVDTSLNNLECSFQVAADGMTRCLPLVAPATESYFADAACTVPVSLFPASCPPPAYVSATPPAVANCVASPGKSIFVRGQTYTSFYSKSGVTCSGPLTTPGGTYFGRGAEVPATTFQVATEAIE